MNLWEIWSPDWLLEHKVSFDGPSRTIHVHPEVLTLDVKTDIYSAWKEWVKLRDNAKFLPSIRTIGGDPIGSGQYAGDMYFLINDWQIIIQHYVILTGVLFSDDNPSPFIILSGGGVTNKVSSLALAYQSGNVGVGTPEEVADAVWSANLNNHTIGGTFGHFIQKKILTLAKYIGLK